MRRKNGNKGEGVSTRKRYQGGGSTGKMGEVEWKIRAERYSPGIQPMALQ